MEIECRALPKRFITAATCSLYHYGCGTYDGKRVQVAQYQLAGVVVAQHFRYPDKTFKWTGDVSSLELFGQHLFRIGGKRIIITEGEIDCMSVYQALGSKWPVVSVPSGAQSAKKYIKEQLEFLESYQEIVLCFDMDEPGQKAAKECALLFTPGKVKLVSLPLKDANDMLKGNRQDELVKALWEAKTHRPDGILAAGDIPLAELQVVEDTQCFNSPYPKLNTMLRGLRKRELSLVVAGSGIGKSTLVREIAAHLRATQHSRIGYVALEESIKKTMLGLIAIENNVPLGELFLNRDLLTVEQWEVSYKQLTEKNNLFLYDHFGSLDNNNLLSRLRYLATGCGVDFIILDHISIVVSGIDDGDERRIIDNLMTNLRSLVESTGVGILAICHLKNPEKGKPHEEGGRVTLNHLRGSGSLKQLSDNVIALERNQQGKRPNMSILRVLKNRLFGENLGVADTLLYDAKTGRLTPQDALYNPEDEQEF